MKVTPALRKDTREAISIALNIPVCPVCQARHPEVNPPLQPLLVPADDREEALRRVSAHVKHEIETSPGQMLTFAEISKRLGIVDGPHLS